MHTAALTASDKRLAAPTSPVLKPHRMHTARVSTCFNGIGDTSMPCKHAWAKETVPQGQAVNGNTSVRHCSHAEGCRGSQVQRALAGAGRNVSVQGTTVMQQLYAEMPTLSFEELCMSARLGSLCKHQIEAEPRSSAHFACLHWPARFTWPYEDKS